MYSCWQIPQNPSPLLRFIFYATGAPTNSAYIVGKFPRSRTDDTQYWYDSAEMRYTDRGARIYWATSRGAGTILRGWGVRTDYYMMEGEEEEEESFIPEAAGLGTTYVSPEEAHYDPVQPDPQQVPIVESAAGSPRMAGGRSAGGESPRNEEAT